MRHGALALIAVVSVVWAAPLWAQARYGEATVEQGELVVLRGGERLQFAPPDSPVDVVERDVLRVGRDSRVVLRTREKSTMTLGSNAVMQIEPWQEEGEGGFFKALFGRVRASIVGLTGGERFNVKTATATIGVKGTKNNFAVTSQGDTTLVGIEDTTDFSASTIEMRDSVAAGMEYQRLYAAANPAAMSDAGPLLAQNEGGTTTGGVSVTPGTMSAMTSTIPEPLPPTATTDDVLGLFADDELFGTPPPNSVDAVIMIGGQVFVARGLLDEEQLDRAEQEQVDEDEQVPGGEEPAAEEEEEELLIYDTGINLDDAQQESNLLRGQLDVQFEK